MNLASEPYSDTLRDRFERHLEAFERRPHEPQTGAALRPAAVALALVGDASRASFLITRRSQGLRDHGGQWALPGGRLDRGETPEAAALRELREELGLSLPLASVMGKLDDYPTRSGFVITPVVLWGGENVVLEPDPEEVAAAYQVPLAELERPEVPVFSSIPESDRPLISIPMLGTLIHAPTAAILYQLREVVLRGRDTRVVDYEQPVFAWS